MSEETHKSELKSEIAQQKVRDAAGHFVHESTPASPLQTVAEHVQFHKTQDDLLDVRVGNPLKRITAILEDIKKQKAFSFTLKGSLGIMGVLLTLSVFGVLGGGQLLCDKGIQSHIGTIKTLTVLETPPSATYYLDFILNYVKPKQKYAKIVLIRDDTTVINVPKTTKVNIGHFEQMRVLVTGDYNSCTQTLTIKEPNAVEVY